MSYRLEVRPQVWNDIAVAAEWYDAREGGLGTEFARAVRDRIEDVQNSRCSHEFAILAARCVGSSHAVSLPHRVPSRNRCRAHRRRYSRSTT